ncbi:hypothetical protein KIW84_022805 [Lathyrus oleraceus]|uniref:Uncharacterized protein n=1 Tax=Pisum sativum TaxID=3888 RepID=A0A9D4YCJ5_PEA|nr:hypothetical protein KIW84_022805 [Pisum sativum]
MISHFLAGPPSHFPFYEMNPMMGGPVFAFAPHDESASTTQSQPQKTTAPTSRPIGSWQQGYSGVESFYGPPTGFTGPFIAPPRGIQGVQGPPHMVVYNHFAPVGQFGQVGLSFMGTTYIPYGKQPDWKHIPTTSAAGTSEGDVNNMNMTSSQRNPASIPSQIQHLAPGSPLLPMASPVAMYDVSPFQHSTEMSVQARWPHISHGPSVDQPLNVKRFTGSRTSTSSDSDRNFSREADVNVNQLPEELGLVKTSNSATSKTLSKGIINKTPSEKTITNATAKVDVQNGNSSKSNNQNKSSSDVTIGKLVFEEKKLGSDVTNADMGENKSLLMPKQEKSLVAPYNTWYPQCDEHMSEVGILPTVNRWDDALDLEHS